MNDKDTLENHEMPLPEAPGCEISAFGIHSCTFDEWAALVGQALDRNDADEDYSGCEDPDQLQLF